MTWWIVGAPLVLAAVGLACAWVLKGRSGLEAGYEASRPEEVDAGARPVEARTHTMRAEEAPRGGRRRV